MHEDLNRNGQRDAGEQGRAGTFVFADLNRNGRYDTGEPATATIAHGAYALTGLTPGTYSVGLVPEDGWRPTEFAEVTIGAGSARADFGRVRHLLGEVAPQTVRAGGRLDVTVPQTAAAAGGRLVFSLEGAVPAGMTIDPATGRLDVDADGRPRRHPHRHRSGPRPAQPAVHRHPVGHDRGVGRAGHAADRGRRGRSGPACSRPTGPRGSP